MKKNYHDNPVKDPIHMITPPPAPQKKKRKKKSCSINETLFAQQSGHRAQKLLQENLVVITLLNYTREV